MPFKKPMYFMPGMVKENSQNALERFFPKIKEAVHMSRQAFSGAQQKVKREAFLELFQVSVRGSCHEILKDWQGCILMAADSSHIAFPRDTGLKAYYGVYGKALTAVTAHALLLYDIENDIIADAKIKPLTVDERSLAKDNLKVLAELEQGFGKWKAIVIFDRGYPSKDFIKYLQDKEITYVTRVPKGFNAWTDGMKKVSKIIRLGEGITIWAVVFTLVGGEREALITNLDKGEWRMACFRNCITSGGR
jgi:hypothetical protein